MERIAISFQIQVYTYVKLSMYLYSIQLGELITQISFLISFMKICLFKCNARCQYMIGNIWLIMFFKLNVWRKLISYTSRVASTYK